MPGIFVIQHDGGLVEMTEASYDSEDLLQELLAKYPKLLAGDQMESSNRSIYGGAIGFMGFDGSFNHAIMIRTFLSRDNKLIYQAGAGVVSKSLAESELQEVNNKLTALRKAVLMAEKI